MSDEQGANQVTFAMCGPDAAARQMDLVPISAKEQAALDKMFEAWETLRAHGWRDLFHAPKDGTTVAVVTAGCTGAHRAHYLGEHPPRGGWWTEEGMDLWPASPTLFKEIAP